MPLSTIERPRLTAASAGGANSTGSLMHPATAGTLGRLDVTSEILDIQLLIFYDLIHDQM